MSNLYELNCAKKNKKICVYSVKIYPQPLNDSKRQLIWHEIETEVQDVLGKVVCGKNVVYSEFEKSEEMSFTAEKKYQITIKLKGVHWMFLESNQLEFYNTFLS